VLLPCLGQVKEARWTRRFRGGLSARHVAIATAPSGREPGRAARAAVDRSGDHRTATIYTPPSPRPRWPLPRRLLGKPAATNEADLANLLEAARASGRRLMVGLNRRFAPSRASSRRPSKDGEPV